MTLAIQKFSANCRAPSRVRLTPDYVERVVRREFTRECAHQMQLLPTAPAIVRVRTLPLKIQIPSSKLTEEALARLWAIEFVRVLSLVLTKGRVAETDVVYVQTRSEWLARFISDLVSGVAQSKWEYEEFADVLRLGTVDAVLTILEREPSEIVCVLQLLKTQRRLDKLLMLFGDFAFEQLFALIAREQPPRDSSLTIDDIVKVGHVAITHSAVRGVLATRIRALQVFLALQEMYPDSISRGWTPRLVFHVLITLDVLVDQVRSLPIVNWATHLTPEFLSQSGRSLNPTVLELLEQIRWVAAEVNNETREQTLASLRRLLDDLATNVSEKTALQKDSYWVSGDFAGFLLLVGLIERLHWPQRILDASLGQRWGSRAVTFCLAVLAKRLLGGPMDDDDLDPGIAVFAGWVKPSAADVGMLRTILSSATDEDRLDLIHALDISLDGNELIVASDWTRTFDCIGSHIVREFASRVRGFRKATIAFIVNTFFRQAGRVCIDDKRILVLLQPNPFHVALHLSSIDEPVDSVRWLDNRRVEFQLEGL